MQFFEAYKMISKIFFTIFPISPSIKLGLTNAHCKLSDYYHHYNASPFYTWAAHMWSVINMSLYQVDSILPVLNPQISYEALKADYRDDPMLSDHLEQSKFDLFCYFDKHYANANTSRLSAPSTSAQTPLIEGSPQKSLTDWYHKKERSSTNKIEDYFKLPAEDFDVCNSIHWWMGWWSRFPHLFQLAHNILCIPGC